MATILVVEDRPDLTLYEAGLLEAAGHRVLRCCGGPAPFAACPLMRYGTCPLPAAADAIVISFVAGLPLRHRTYRGEHLLGAYRAHPDYGRLPMLVVGGPAPPDCPGAGPLRALPPVPAPLALVDAVEALLAHGGVTEPRVPAGSLA